MNIIRKAPATPTHDERIAAAEAKKGAALSVFALAVDDLRAAEAEALAVHDEIEEEIERLVSLRGAAADAADAAAEKATTLSAFLG